MSLVIDASAALAFCLEDERALLPHHYIDTIESSFLLVPPHWWAEVGNGLLMVERRKRIDAAAYRECIAMLADLEPGVLDIRPQEMEGDVVLLARKHRLTVYDACYLYLAARENQTLITLDKALKKAAHAERLAVL